MTKGGPSSYRTPLEIESTFKHAMKALEHCIVGDTDFSPKAKEFLCKQILPQITDDI